MSQPAGLELIERAPGVEVDEIVESYGSAFESVVRE